MLLQLTVTPAIFNVTKFREVFAPHSAKSIFISLVSRSAPATDIVIATISCILGLQALGISLVITRSSRIVATIRPLTVWRLIEFVIFRRFTATQRQQSQSSAQIRYSFKSHIKCLRIDSAVTLADSPARGKALRVRSADRAALRRAKFPRARTARANRRFRASAWLRRAARHKRPNAQSLELVRRAVVEDRCWPKVQTALGKNLRALDLPKEQAPKGCGGGQ
jgi:hypothetical protein